MDLRCKTFINCYENKVQNEWMNEWMNVPYWIDEVGSRFFSWNFFLINGRLSMPNKN